MPHEIATPLVLIPALLCDAVLYRDVLADLGDRVDAHVVVATRPTVAASVRDILASAPERFVLGGSSYGGTIAIEVALAAPERVVALWLNGCDPGASDRDGSLAVAGMIEGSVDAAAAQLATIVVRAEATEAAATFAAMAARIGGATGGAQMRALAARESAWDRLGQLTMRALVVWGADDATISLAVGRRLAGALPNARLHVLPHTGHLPVLERPREVATIVREWLETPTRSVS